MRVTHKEVTGPVRIEMPYEAEWIIDNIRSHGYEAFIVGGCVRDAVLGRIPGDWDITTLSMER